MQRSLAILLLLACVPAFADETQLQSDLRREKEELASNCSSFKGMFGCAQTVVTGKPLHLSIGSVAPQNGVGFGPGFTYDKNLGENWRTNTTVDAVVTTNQSWRAGAYFKAFYMPHEKVHVITGPAPPPKALPEIGPRAVPTFNLYVQAISLNKLDYYGLGASTSRQNLALFGLTETILGGNVIYPILGHSGISLFGELNGRFFDPRGRHADKSPSVEQVFSEPAAPGLLRQLGYFQAGEGVRFDREIGDRLSLDYRVTLQQFQGVTDSRTSFQRFTVDASHEFPLYRKQRSQARRTSEKPHFTFNREGSIGLRALLTESYIPRGNEIPFYLQPTLGGSDINGDHWLSSYPDYRFRAPNLLVFRGSFEHVIWGPIGGMFQADYGKVALSQGDLGFNHFRHSYGLGITIRGGGIPAVSILFAFGGGEGTHTIANINPALLGGATRPSLY